MIKESFSHYQPTVSPNQNSTVKDPSETILRQILAEKQFTYSHLLHLFEESLSSPAPIHTYLEVLKKLLTRAQELHFQDKLATEKTK